MINELGKQIHKNNIEKGFYEDEKNIGEMLALIHSEVSEALEADRKDQWCADLSLSWAESTNDDGHYMEHYEDSIKGTFQDELADIMIRVMDLATFKEIDLESHISAKMKYNSMRQFKHGKKY